MSITLKRLKSRFQGWYLLDSNIFASDSSWRRRIEPGKKSGSVRTAPVFKNDISKPNRCVLMDRHLEISKFKAKELGSVDNTEKNDALLRDESEIPAVIRNHD